MREPTARFCARFPWCCCPSGLVTEAVVGGCNHDRACVSGRLGNIAAVQSGDEGVDFGGSVITRRIRAAAGPGWRRYAPCLPG